METTTYKTNSSKKYFSFFLSILLYFLGIAGLIFVIPKFAHNTYLSENALIPLYSRAPFRISEVQYAENLSNQISNFFSQNESTEKNHQFIFELLQRQGFETYTQKFNTRSSAEEWSENIYAILRATKSQGIEALAISTCFDTEELGEPGSISSLGFSITILGHLKKLDWRAKDIILILTPKQYEQIGLSSWIDAYHHLDQKTNFQLSFYENQNEKKLNFSNFESVKHCGAIHAALNLDFSPTKKFNTIIIKPEGNNGQLPNLDLINTIGTISSNLLNLKVEGSGPFKNAQVILEKKEFLKKFNFKVSGIDVFPESLFTMMINQALGIPTGNHGFWIKYHIDCVTLSLASNPSIPPVEWSQFGTLVIGTLRSLNNILEHLHQSFYFYFLISIKQYTSIGEYMTCFGLILAGLFFKIFLTIINFKYDFKVIHALSVTLLFHAAGLMTFLFPYFVSNDYKSWTIIFIIFNHFLYFSIFFLIPLINKRFNQKIDKDIAFQSSTFFAPMIFITTQSLLNFSFSLFGAVFIIPLGLFTKSNSMRSFIMKVFILFFFEPFIIMFGISFFLEISISELIQIIFIQYQLYGNFWYPFVYLIYQPMIYGLLYLILPDQFFQLSKNEKINK